jgi:hypothetical protein
MKFLTIIFMVLMMSGCLKEGIKDTGDAVQDGVGAVLDAGKKAPKQIGDASNEVEKDIRD